MIHDPTVAVTPVSGGGSCITLDEAKLQCRIPTSNTDHDTELTRLAEVATSYVERRTRRQLVTANWLAFLDRFPQDGRREIVLPLPPLSAVNSVQYVDGDGATQTLAITVYEADADSEPGRIVLKPDESWPAVQSQKHHAVTIDFDAGYGPASAVPEKIRHAALMVLAHWFNRREAELIGSISKELEFAVSALLGDVEVPLIG